ncbi:hypothetical protein RRG08_050112 [Elysia crispata]|uniref:Uncharacterized protein n=1 Tax=Elysia crispata TaxID=231223 RepID=A0AAE1DB47_9GAST|nr:hypothetical protein RRG08_050112 [Elysia crispata]
MHLCHEVSEAVPTLAPLATGGSSPAECEEHNISRRQKKRSVWSLDVRLVSPDQQKWLRSAASILVSEETNPRGLDTHVVVG